MISVLHHHYMEKCMVMSIKRFRNLLLLLLVMIPLLGCAAFSYSTGMVNILNPRLTPTVVQISPGPGRSSSDGSQNQEELLIYLYSQANPAVVNITIYQQVQQEMVPVGTGSGFVYDDKGRIVTNAHVVQDAEQVDVTFSNGLIQSAKIIGIDLNSDLAIIQVDPFAIFMATSLEAMLKSKRTDSPKVIVGSVLRSL